MKKKKKYCGEHLFSSQAYFYNASPSMSNSFRFIFKWDENINADALRIAADKCAHRFPYLMVCEKRNWNRIFLIPNNRPIAIIESSEPVCLNSEETNYHLLALSYSKKEMCFSAFHGLLDGNGAFMFLRSLFYYYIKEKYHEEIPSEGIFLEEDAISEEEYMDPFLKLKRKHIFYRALTKSLPMGNETETLFRIEEDKRVKKSSPYSFYVKLSKKEMISYCKKNDSSPATLASLLLARAIRELNRDSQKTIRGALDMNLRNVLQAPHAHHSLVGKIALEYDVGIEGKDYAEQNTVNRGRVILKSDEDWLYEELLERKRFYKKIQKKISLKAKEKYIRENRQRTDNRNFTYAVSYTGLFANESIERHIQSFYIDVDAKDVNILLEVTSINENFFITFLQEWSEKIYFEAFCEELGKVGLSYEVERTGAPSIPRYEC